MDTVALAACAFGLFVVGRMLVLGSATPNGEGFRRDEESAAYWTTVAFGCVVVCMFFYIAIYDPFGA